MHYFIRICCLKIIILLSFLQIVQKSYSQVQKTVFQHLTTKNGLSQNLVTSILRDKRGYMWFATWNGLNYYNGYNFITYKNDSTKNSISSNIINSICDDENGDLWIGTNNGLNKFIFNENRFIQYFHDPSNPHSIADNYIKSVFRDKNNNIWIGTNSQGVDKLSFKNNKPYYKHYQNKKDSFNSISANKIYCIIEDHLGNIIIGTTNGLNRLNPHTDKIEVFQNDPNNNNSLTNNSIYSIAEGKDHTLWVGSKLGLTKVDTKHNVFTRYYANPNNPEALANNAIRSIAEDVAGNILIGTLDGLHRYNSTKNNFFRFGYSPTDEYSLDNNFVSCLFSDPDGNVWVGTEKGGVNKYNISQQKFFNFVYKPNNSTYLNSNIVNSIYEDSLYIWIGTAGGGLNQYDKHTHLFKYHISNPSNPKSISHNYISAITKDSNGNLWVATWGLGINKLTDIKKGAFKNYAYATANTDSINWNLVSCMLEFPKGNLWIGSRFGLSRMKLKTEKISILHIPAIGNVPFSHLTCLMSDSKHNLWVGTEEGVYRIKWNNNQLPDLNKPDSIFKYANDRKNKSSIAGNHVLSILEDKHGNLWFSTYGFGLEKLSPGNLKGAIAKFDHYNKSDSQLESIIYGILQDHNNNLWLSTENGLQKFNPEKNTCQSFFESDGIQGNQFYWSSYYKNSSGKMFFGGLQGLTFFYPDSIKESKPIEKVIFTDFKIFNKSVPVNIDNKNALHQNINNTDHIELRHWQNVFTLEFTGVSYDINSNAKYAYKLEGFDENWIYADNSRRYATYTNLSPGSYLFRVKVANRDGIWNSDDTTMRIIIHPEWWQTLLFKVVAVLFLSLSILSFYFWRIYNLKRRQRKLELMVEQRTMLLHEQTQEILSQKDEILAQKDEISDQNHRLQIYGTHLEEMVRERTIDLEHAKNKAEEADKLKTSFLANLSHEIRTPLNAIVGFSSLITQSNSPSDPVKEWANAVVSNNDMLLHLIDDIIDFAKIESGQVTIKNQQFKIYHFVKNIFETYQMKVERKIISSGNISLRLVVEDEYKSMIAYSDESRVNQILGNLINNALKFTFQGFIEIGYKPFDNKNILVWVKDTGIGIDPKNHEIIFKRFRKVEDERNVLYRGTGLGLAIVKHLVGLVGGKIWLESELGHGSTFYFTIAREPSALLSTDIDVNNESPAPLPDLRFRHILVAEDEDDNYRYIETVLKKEKATVTRAKNGKEAIEHCYKIDNFDIILMDIKMPVMNGIDATIEIKKIFPSIPIFAVTAYTMSDEKENILKAGFDEYLAKPVIDNYLIQLIMKYLKV